MKTNLTIILVAGAACFFSVLAGGRIAREKCRADYAQKLAENAAEYQIKNDTIKRKINAETFNTGGSDIRNFLHTNYTIKD